MDSGPSGGAAGLTEIRWHARGGQGAVTAAKMVAELALGQGKYFQAFPEYGPERSGAPIVAFTRVSDDPINIYSGVEHPQIVVVLDASLISAVDVTRGASNDVVILVNTELPPGGVRERYGLKGGRLFTVDASRIAMETLRRAIPNTPMIGALAKATGLFQVEDVAEFIRHDFAKKFSAKVVEGNIAALTRSYDEVRGE
ncbi:MAG: 2-oxoacid:acceptor oxidoreductase family protein [Actinobacteria bacterium]|nr:2-oxoacid:acceptor oxidoreductase family protein [Actinomycetota bacterium]